MMENEMSYEEFKEQDKYCRENNTPEGLGCGDCPGEHSICADNIRNIIGKIQDENIIFAETINQANIEKIGYIKGEGGLYIKFYSGTVTRYNGVGEEMFIKAIKAQSVGSFLHRYLKGNYSYERIV